MKKMDDLRIINQNLFLLQNQNTPILQSRTVNGTTLTLTYNIALDSNSVPATNAFTLGGTSATVSSVGVSGTTVTLTLGNGGVLSGQTVTISYTAGASPIQSENGDYDAPNFTNQSVTNNTPPVLSSATVNGVTLTLTYNSSLNTSSTPATTDFAVTVNAVSRSVNTVQVIGSTVVLTLSSAVIGGQTVLISYTAGVNPIENSAGINAANLTNQAVTNNSPISPSDLSGLKGWFDVTQMPVVADGTNCANLTDFSGNSNTIPQAALNLGGKYYNSVRNGKPVLRFNGTSEFYSGNNKKWIDFITASACTIFAVCKITIDTNTNTIAGDDGLITDGEKCGIHFRTSSGGKVYFANNDGNEDHAETSLASATWALVQARHESGSIYIKVNNGSEISAASGDLNNLSAGNLIIPGSASPYTGGDIGEICIYNRALSSTELALLYNYMAEKWGF